MDVGTSYHGGPGAPLLAARCCRGLQEGLCGGSELALSWQLVGMVSYRRATYAMFSAPVPWPAGGGARSPGAAGAARRQITKSLGNPEAGGSRPALWAGPGRDPDP